MTTSGREIPVELVMTVVGFFVILYGVILLFCFLDSIFGNLYRLYKEPQKFVDGMIAPAKNSSWAERRRVHKEVWRRYSAIPVFLRASTKVKIVLVLIAAGITAIVFLVVLK